MSAPQSPQSPQSPHSGAASVLDRFADGVRGTGIRRPLEGRVLGGVCQGVGCRYGIDPLLLRVVFVVATPFALVGLLLYVAAVLILPDSDGGVPLVRAIRERDGKSIALLALFGFLLLSPGFGDSNTDWGRTFITVAMILGVGAYLVSRKPGAPGETDLGAGAQAGVSEPSAQAGQPGGLVFDPETGGWRPSDTVRGDAGGTPPTQPLAGQAYGPPPTGPAYVPPAPQTAVAPVDVEAVRAARRHARLITLTTLAFAVVVFVGTYLLLRSFTEFDAQLAFAVTLGALGLVLIGSGARRVRNRAAVWLVILGLVAAPAMAAAPNGYSIPDVSTWSGAQGGVGDVRMTPASVSELQESHQLGLGSMDLDLTQLPTNELKALDARPLDLSVGLGDITIAVPTAMSVRIVPEVGMGDVRVIDDTNPAGNRTDDATVGSRAPIQLGTGEPDMIISADLGMGSLTVTRR